MGIQGLLPFLKKIHTPVNVAQFEGCTVAIDAYCWLHKGAFSCADKLALGEKTNQYVYYCMKYLEYMLRKNIKPIMVFDGCHLPSKKDVEKSRREKREMYRKKAAQMLREGRRAEARDCLQRCIDISPDMALELMNTCRARGIDCIVAPYEADAQLAYLNKSGIAQVIITEDSDLLLFGCEKIIFKMDHFGNGVLIEKSRLNEVLSINSGVYSFERFRYMCILSGCDYLPSLSGIGLVKACKVFKLARQSELKQVLKKFPSTYLKMSMDVPTDYIEGFIKANNTFLYQLVFDPLKRELVPLNSYPPDINIDQLHYAGPYIVPDKALQIALGNINIYTGEKFADFNPDTYMPEKASKKPSNCLHHLSIWNKNYRIRPNVELKENANSQRPNLGGKEKEYVVKFHKKSPVKRLRPAEEYKESKSDMELSDFYTSEFDAGSAAATKSPQRKKFKTDSEESEFRREILRRFSFSSKHAPVADEEEEEDVPSSPRHSPADKKLFISSLKEADQEVSINTLASPESTPVNDKMITEKENVASPKKNRFAVLLANTRPRFDINAKKEVKSRFFVTSSNSGKPIEDTPLMDGTEYSALKQKETDDLTQVSQTPKTKSSGPQTCAKQDRTKTKSPCRTSSKSPKGSAFSWSKFKFTSDNAASDSSKTDLQKKSSPVNSQFKKVVSDLDLTGFFTKSSSGCESEACSQQNSDTDKSLGDDSGIVNSQLNSVDSYCSIDSFCLGSSQESEVSCNSSQMKDDILLNSNAEEKQYADTESRTLPQQNIRNTSNPKSSENAKGTKLGIKGKGGCRVSGLTKASRSKSSLDKINSKQRSVKDMFSQFAHSKTNVARLKKSQSSPVKVDDDIEIAVVTPSQYKSDFSVLEGVQRKLLP